MVMAVALLISACCVLLLPGLLPIATGGSSFVFEQPVLIGASDPSKSPQEHYWFPEWGAKLSGRVNNLLVDAVLTTARFVPDGKPPPPGLRHKTESKISTDGGRTYRHLWFNKGLEVGAGTATLATGGAIKPGMGCVPRSDNRSLACQNERFWLCNGITDPQILTVCTNFSSTSSPIIYRGFPFDVARFTSYAQTSTVVTIPDAKVIIIMKKIMSTIIG